MNSELAKRGHVLLVYYFFAPAVGGGIPRPAKLAKYLRRLGWEVSVLTVAAPGEVDARLEVSSSARVGRVREWQLDLLLRAADGILRAARRGWERAVGAAGTDAASLLERGVVDEEREIEASKIGWVSPGIRAALKLNRQHPIDVAVVSSPPASSGTIGVLLRALRGVPYVVEYRDPWTVGAFWTLDPAGGARTDPVTRARYRLTRGLEARLLSGASGAVIVNGEDHVARLRAEFPVQTTGKPVVHIPNGVDLEDAADLSANLAPRAPDRPLRLLHSGFFYHFHTPHHLFDGLRAVHQDRPEILNGVELEFLGGGFPDQLAQEAESWGLGAHLRVTPTASFSDSLRAVHSADGLLVVLPPLVTDRDRIPTKIYEYLSSTLPIFAVVDPGGATARLLDGVPGTLIADNRDSAAIAAGLMEFIEMAHKLRASGPSEDYARRACAHDYGERAERMDALLRGIVHPHDGPGERPV